MGKGGRKGLINNLKKLYESTKTVFKKSIQKTDCIKVRVWYLGFFTKL